MVMNLCSREQGVIIKSEFGNYSFDREKRAYLEIEIQLFDGWLTTMTFDSDMVYDILAQFLPNYSYRTVSGLIGRRVELQYDSDSLTSAPIAMRPKSNSTWFYKKVFV